MILAFQIQKASNPSTTPTFNLTQNGNALVLFFNGNDNHLIYVALHVATPSQFVPIHIADDGTSHNNTC